MKHEELEDRSLELHRKIARKLRSKPELLSVAQDNIKRWNKRSGYSEANRMAMKEWREILSQPLSRIIQIMVSSDEESARLRQSSPFVGILSVKQRLVAFHRYESRRT